MYFIVVNKHRVRSNAKGETALPVFRVSRGKHGKPWYANEIKKYSGRASCVTRPTTQCLVVHPCGSKPKV